MIEANLGMNQRFGGGADFDREERFDLAYRLGLWLTAIDAASFGLELEHAGLGSGSDQTGANLVTARYSTNMAWLGGRVVPWRSVDVETFVGLRVGIGLQHIFADGVRAGDSLAEPARAFSCSETDGPGFGLGAGIGAALGLGRHLRLLGRLDGTGLSFGDDVIGGCAVGAGSPTSVSLAIGLSYGFDVAASDGDPFAGGAPSPARKSAF